MEMTVAGTAQDLHLIPFYVAMEHRSITNSAAKVHIFLQTAATKGVFLIPTLLHNGKKNASRHAFRTAAAAFSALCPKCRKLSDAFPAFLGCLFGM